MNANREDAVESYAERGARVRAVVADHEPDNPQGKWCCDEHRTAYFGRTAASRSGVDS